MRLLLLTACLAASSSAAAQPNVFADGDASGPRAAFERFRALSEARQLNSDEGRALLAGELDQVTAPSLGPIDAPDRVLLIGPDEAVARVPAAAPRILDSYVYLSRSSEGAWSITAFRQLALTRIIELLRNELRALPTRSPEQEVTLRNAELTLASDRNLAAWFSTHREDLEELRLLAQAGGPGRADSPAARGMLARLGLSVITREENGPVQVIIGGMVDNSVGFLHAADPALVPSIGPSEYIWIEPLGGGWYLFRTT